MHCDYAAVNCCSLARTVGSLSSCCRFPHVASLVQGPQQHPDKHGAVAQVKQLALWVGFEQNRGFNARKSACFSSVQPRPRGGAQTPAACNASAGCVACSCQPSPKSILVAAVYVVNECLPQVQYWTVHGLGNEQDAHCSKTFPAALNKL